MSEARNLTDEQVSDVAKDALDLIYARCDELGCNRALGSALVIWRLKDSMERAVAVVAILGAEGAAGLVEALRSREEEGDADHE